jgi:Zn-dependent peptidase ImmA (M78 family)/DNA-binding XRE family transcriptional regulator
MTINILDNLDTRELGKELRQARKLSGLTQEEAAAILDVARTTITAIEKGDRRIKVDELIQLAKAYGRQVSDFVRPRSVIEPFQVQFRGPFVRSAVDNAKIAPYVQQLEELARDYLELERILEAPLTHRYPPEYSIAGLKLAQAAEDIAAQERNRLGLGDGPIPILRDILEQEVGLRIFYIRLPSKFSAMYLYDHQLGGCIALNSEHHEERRRWSLAHDYGHFLISRYKPVLYIEDGYERLPESERFVDLFALYFLMPTSSLTRRFNDIRRTKGKVTPADLCILAYYYGVSVEALSRRLEDMRLLPTGTWDKLRAGGFKVREAQKELGLEPLPAHDTSLPMRYQYLAIEAFDRALITEGRFAQFLRIDRLEARRLAEVLREEAVSMLDDTPVSLDLSQPLDIQEDPS